MPKSSSAPACPPESRGTSYATTVRIDVGPADKSPSLEALAQHSAALTADGHIRFLEEAPGGRHHPSWRICYGDLSAVSESRACRLAFA
jgi:hypothetical protein